MSDIFSYVSIACIISWIMLVDSSAYIRLDNIMLSNNQLNDMLVSLNYNEYQYKLRELVCNGYISVHQFFMYRDRRIC